MQSNEYKEKNKFMASPMQNTNTVNLTTIYKETCNYKTYAS